MDAWPWVQEASKEAEKKGKKVKKESKVEKVAKEAKDVRRHSPRAVSCFVRAVSGHGAHKRTPVKEAKAKAEVQDPRTKWSCLEASFAEENVNRPQFLAQVDLQRTSLPW